MDLEEMCEVAIFAAIEAGNIISSAELSKIEVKVKEGGENIASCVVTEVDLMAEKKILEILKPTIDKYNLGLLAEESCHDNSRFENEYFWCIDPLDGTLAFSRGEDGYSSSIALINKRGEPIIGVVYDSKNKNLYHAIKDRGSYRNNKKLNVVDGGKKLTLLYDQSFKKDPNYESIINNIDSNLLDLGLTDFEEFHLGGAVMNGISTIELSPALYFKYPKKADGGGSIWDFAASSIIQSEAGGFNSDFYGNKLNLNQIGTTFMNKYGIIYSSREDLLLLIKKF